MPFSFIIFICSTESGLAKIGPVWKSVCTSPWVRFFSCYLCVCVCVCVCVSVCLCVCAQSCPTLCKPMACSPPGSLSTGFPRQEYWSGLSFPPPGDLLNPQVELESLASPALAGRFFKWHLVVRRWTRDRRKQQQDGDNAEQPSSPLLRCLRGQRLRS